MLILLNNNGKTMKTNKNIVSLLVFFVICATITPTFAQSLPTSFCGVTFGEVIPDDLIPDPDNPSMPGGTGMKINTEYYYINQKGCPDEWNGWKIKNVIFWSVNNFDYQGGGIVDGVRFDLVAKDHRQAVQSLNRAIGIKAKEKSSIPHGGKIPAYNWTWKDEKITIQASSAPNKKVAPDLYMSLSRNDATEIELD